jgi:hypothetical protein
MDKETWIRERAYFIWELKKKCGFEDDPMNNWLDAEYEFNLLFKHCEDFKSRFGFTKEIASYETAIPQR